MVDIKANQKKQALTIFLLLMIFLLFKMDMNIILLKMF